MKLGISLPTSHQGIYLPSPFAGAEELTAIIRMAERLGFYSAWVLDFMTPAYERHKLPGAAPQWYEAMQSLSYLAAMSETIRLGTATIQLPLRDPFLLARQAATLDALSGGRCLLGVALGQSRAEFIGIRPRDAAMHRGTLLEESLEALHRFFHEEVVTFEGETYQCRDLRLTPRPVQSPFPIYLAGATKEQPRRVARWGSGWLLSRAHGRSIDECVNALLPHLEAAGRERSEIELVVTKGLSLGKTEEQAFDRFNSSMLVDRMQELAREFRIDSNGSKQRLRSQNLIGTAESVAEQLDTVRLSGVDHCVLMYFAVSDSNELLDQLQWFGEEVLPLLDWANAGV